MRRADGGPLFVAEVSSNHGRDLRRCLAFIDKAAEIGCDAVKFQLFRVRDLFAPEVLARSAEHRKREKWELPVEFLPVLAERCRRRKILFSCTPFSLEAVRQLRPFVRFYKVASYELLWDDLLGACARTGKPVVLSTGMATLEEVRRASEVLRKNGGRDVTLLHCVSRYPAPLREVNLAALEEMRRACRCETGWSDHTVDPAVVHRAVHRWGASMVEFHLDLEGKGAEFSSGHCWLPGQMAPVIADVRRGFQADGRGKKAPAPGEKEERLWRADPSDGLRPLLRTRRGL